MPLFLSTYLAVAAGGAPGPARTLLDLGGAKRPVHEWSGAVLVVIDAQQEYSTGRLPLPGVTPSAAVIERLLGAARASGAGVVHVRHRGRAGGLFDPAGAGYAAIAGLDAVAGEPVVDKTLPNAFAKTTLHELLQARFTGRTLVLAGYMTHMCVSSTARAALDLGYTTTVVADATATRDLPGADGRTVAADTLQAAELAALGDRFAWIVRSEELLAGGPSQPRPARGGP